MATFFKGSFSAGLLKKIVPPRVTKLFGIGSSFQRDWLRTDLNVIGFGLIGWLAPSSVPAINGDSLTGLFFQSIGTELSHFPIGPALTSPFWSVYFLFQTLVNHDAHSLVWNMCVYSYDDLYVQVVDGLLAPGAVLVPDFWANWVQGEVWGLLLRRQMDYVYLCILCTILTLYLFSQQFALCSIPVQQ